MRGILSGNDPGLLKIIHLSNDDVGGSETLSACLSSGRGCMEMALALLTRLSTPELLISTDVFWPAHPPLVLLEDELLRGPRSPLSGGLDRVRRRPLPRGRPYSNVDSRHSPCTTGGERVLLLL